jgi:hypothetical protein
VSGVGVLLVLIVFYVAVSLPAYIIGTRRGVESPGVAFIPLVGPTIVMLWSMEESGWLTLLTLVPLVNLVFSIWLYFAMPNRHGRTRWWGAVILFIPIIGLVVYALTLEEGAAPATA